MPTYQRTASCGWAVRLMTTEELYRLVRRAEHLAAELRAQQPHAEYEMEARAWDAFASAADHLHARRKRSHGYTPGPPIEGKSGLSGSN